MPWTLEHGDALEVLRTMPDNSVDAVVTDPPAGISFMGKTWDNHKGGRQAWVGWLATILSECFRIAKPGSRLLCWSIPRTSHWTGCAVEDAGWVIENQISHLFGSGFPKAKTQLKPGREDWWLARKPSKGVPPLNIDECRAGTSGGTKKETFPDDSDSKNTYGNGLNGNPVINRDIGKGRWPANVVFSHSEGCADVCVDDCPIRALDEQTGTLKSGSRKAGVYEGGLMRNVGLAEMPEITGDSGGASRFFNTFAYYPKASPSDRGAENKHPTVKSTPLMRYLCRLVTPKSGTILDPFTGSGSTGRAAVLEGFSFIGIEQDADYIQLAYQRISEVES